MEKLNIHKVGIERWEQKIKEIESGETERITPYLKDLPKEKRLEYCKMMIDNIKNNTNKRINFGSSGK